MSLVTPIRDLFAEPMPPGANLDASTRELKGKTEEDLSRADIDELDSLAEVFQDFRYDPASWIRSMPASAPRRPKWVELAQALGVTVTSGPAPATATPTPSAGVAASTAPVDPPAFEPVPEQGIDPDALAGGAPPSDLREKGGSRGAGGISIRTNDGDGDERPSRVRRTRREPDPDEDKDGARGEPEQPGRVHTPPAVSRITRMVPAHIINILRVETFKKHRGVILKLFEAIRSGDATKAKAAQKNLLAYEENLLLIRRAMPTEYLVMSSAELALDMIRNLRAGKDQSEPDWFQANYHSGRYLNE